MSTDPSFNGEDPQSQSPSDSWREVGEQIHGLVSRIAEAFRGAWAEERSSEPTQHDVGERLEDDLRATADRLERVFKRVAAETEEERSATVKTTRAASSKAVGEARVVAARGLRALNEQLDQLAKTLERERADREQNDNHTDDGPSAQP
ncbi:MAG TPA: hypothetical protein VHV31_01445 [Nitrolancea sp.]|jgi:hypothetical protein|nr:hypothetical protein [Nitrolancea sp.]